MTGSVAGPAMVLAVVVAALSVLGTAAPARADSTTLPGSLSTLARQTGPLTVTVPPGTTPVAVTGVLAMPAVVDGSTTTVLVNGREALTVPSALYSQVRVPLLPSDVVADGTLALTLRYDAPPGAAGCAPDPEITLRRLGLVYSGTETPPESVAAFFPASASRIDVQVPRDASDDVLQAALDAVAALSHRYPEGTPVVLSASDTPLPTGSAGERVVSIVGAGSTVSTTLDPSASVPTLVLAGAGAALSDAASALGVDPDQSAPSGSRREGRTRSLAQLREDSPDLPASAPGTEVVGIHQDSFGAPVSALTVHLEGTHSAVPAGAGARLDVYFDDRLVSSAVIGADPAIDLDVTIPGSVLRSVGVLRASVLSVADPTRACSLGLPLELSLNPERSTVTATPGVGTLDGFQLFPQVLDGRLPVAIRPDGPARVDAAIDAAGLISSLQRQGAVPLEVTVVDPDLLVASSRSGLVVGASYADSVAVDAPLRLSGTRLPTSAQVRFGVAGDAPFAALEAVHQRRRYVLLLGSWAPGDTAATPAMSRRIVDRVAGVGWNALGDDVMVAGPGGAVPATVASGAAPTVADPVAPDAPDRSYLFYLAAAVVLLLLLGVQVVLAQRRDRPRSTRIRRAPGGGGSTVSTPAVRRPERRWFGLRVRPERREPWVDERDEDELTPRDQ